MTPQTLSSTGEIADTDTDTDTEQQSFATDAEQDTSLVEEVSIDGMCGVY